jgi:RNA polymerase sigma factor (sigma-70 family)
MTATLLRPSRWAIGRYHHAVSNAQFGDHADALGAAFARGEATLRAVYDAHAPLVYAICRKALGDDRAGEVTQDVFVGAWRGREQFDPSKGSLAGWLVGITKRRIIDNVRRERRHSDRRADSVDEQAADNGAAEIDRLADRMTVAAALHVLPDRGRQMIEMAYIEGLTHQDIADRTGVPLGTVKSDIRRGLLTLRAHLEGSHE